MGERLESNCSCHTISTNWFLALWPMWKACFKLLCVCWRLNGCFLEELLMFLSAICIWQWVCYSHVMGWFGFYYVISRDSVHCPRSCLRAIKDHLQQLCPTHTTAVEGQDGRNWTYKSSIDFHIWEHLYRYWSLIRLLWAQLEQVAQSETALWLRSYSVCLLRNQSGWDFTTGNFNCLTGRFPSQVP